MNAKKYFVTAIVFNTVLLAVAACYYHPWETQCGGADTALSGAPGKFGPVIEVVLPAVTTKATAGILDMETGRTLSQPPFEQFESGADVITTWFRTNGLDISCSVWPTLAACITYDMTVIAVEGKSWKETTEQELLDNPALTPRIHSPRRQLVLGQNRPDTYIFRTGDGTLGILHIVGVTKDRQGVKLRYKLVNPRGNTQTSSGAGLFTSH